MSLQDELKARTLALISTQMANWVVEIQNNIRQHQGNLVSALDELQETVARYDERINEGEVEAAMADVVASQPAAVAAGPGLDALRASMVEIDKGSNLSEILTYLVNEVSQYIDRAAMFIVKGSSAIGWYSRGIQQAESVKLINIPLTADTLFRNIQHSRQSMRGHIAHTPGTAQALAKLGGRPQGILAVPLILREKLAAILYCDTAAEEVPGPEADLIEILVLYAAKCIDLISVAPKPVVGRTTTAGTTTDRAAAIRAGGEEIRERANVPRSVAPPPPPAPPQADEGSSTVMFKSGAFPEVARAAPAPPPPPPPRPAPAPTPAAHPPEDHKAHEDAKRFARLVVSEIKLYNEAKVAEGRRQKDLYERLKEDIERGRQMYADRVPAPIRDSTNYFYDELVRILAGGDTAALGPM